MRKYASAEERVAKNQKTTVRHFGFTEKVYGLSCTVRTLLLWKRRHRNAIVLFMGRHSSGRSPKALKAIAWWKVREVWREEARGRPKLGMLGRLMTYECKARCVEVDGKRQKICWQS